MSTSDDTWNVQPHGPVIELDQGLITIEGTITMPLGKFPRRMTVAQSATGSVVYSAMAVDENAMRRIEAFGAPRVLVVPSAHHRLDIRAWKARFPSARVVAPAGAREAVEKVIAVDDTSGALDDADLRLETIDGTGQREFALLVSRPDGKSLVVNDMIAFVAHPDGVGAKIMARLMGFGVKHPQIPSVAKMGLVKDKPAVAAHFRRWAALPDLRRIVVSHGEVIEQPRETLETLAEALE